MRTGTICLLAGARGTPYGGGRPRFIRQFCLRQARYYAGNA